MLKDRIFKVLAAILIAVSMTMAAQIDFLSKVWTNAGSSDPATTIFTPPNAGVLTLSAKFANPSPWAVAQHISSNDVIYRNIESFEITYTSNVAVAIRLNDQPGRNAAEIDGTLAAGRYGSHQALLPPAPNGRTLVLNLWDFMVPDWVDSRYNVSLESRIRFINGLLVVIGAPGLTEAQVSISRLVANLAKNPPVEKSIDLAKSNNWAPSSGGGATASVGRKDNGAIEFSITRNQAGWANIFYGSFQDWGKVIGIRITYSSNQPLVLSFNDLGYADLGGFHTTLPATGGVPQTRELSLWDFTLPSNVNTARRKTLQSRFIAVSGVSISTTATTGVQASASGEISELLVYGLEEQPVDFYDFAQAPDKWTNAGAGTSSKNIVFNLANASAGIDFDFLGDWSECRGFSFYYYSNEPIALLLKNRNGAEIRYDIPFGELSPPQEGIEPIHPTYGALRGFCFSLGNFDMTSTFRQNGISVLDMNITGIRIIPATSNPTSGSIAMIRANGVLAHQYVDVVWDEQTEFVFNGGIQAPTATARTRSGATLALNIEGGATDAREQQYTAIAALATPNSAFTLRNNTRNFKIVKAAISPTLNIEGTIKTENQLNPEVIGNFGNATFTIEYSDSENGNFKAGFPTAVGTYFARANIPATANYNAATTPPVEFAVLAADAAEVAVEWGSTLSFTYDGTMQAPTARVARPGSDRKRFIDLVVDGAINQGTHKARARLEFPNVNFVMTGTRKDFTINHKPLSENMILPVDDVLWTGAQIKPGVVVKDDGKILGLGVDYEIAGYGANIDVGTGSVRIRGIGNYTGEETIEFRIFAANIGLTPVSVIWDEQESFVYNGKYQAPRVIAIHDVFGNLYDFEIEGERKNAGKRYVAKVNIDLAKYPNQTFILDEPAKTFHITPKPLAVSWSSKREFVFDKMVQGPTPSVSEQSVELRRKDDNSDVGEHTNSAVIVSSNADNYTLTNNSVNYKIVEKELDVVLPEEIDVNANQNITNEAQLLAYLNTILDFEGFQTDTLKIADISDSAGSVFTETPKIVLTKLSPSLLSSPLRSEIGFMSGGVKEIFKIQVIGAASANYALPADAIEIEVRSPGGITSINNIKKSDKRYGIKFAQNIVSEKAEMSVVLPASAASAGSATEVSVVIYDMTGNAVFERRGDYQSPAPRRGWEQSDHNNAIIWDLRNSAGRFVANGTYLVIAEAKTASGKTYTYSARLGVKR